MPKVPSEKDHRPIHTLRHRRLKATIWRNPTDAGVLFNVIVTRSYRDKATQAWHDTHSLGYDDLMNVVGLLQEARTFISELIAKVPARKPAPRPVAKPTKRPAPLLPSEEVPY